MGVILQFLGSLFGGVGVVLLWELLLKPSRERRNLAIAVVAEVSRNLDYGAEHLRALDAQQDSRGVPPDFRLSTTVFTSLTSRLGDLPPIAVAELVRLYHQFDELNRLPDEYRTLQAELRGADDYLSSHLALQEQEVMRELFPKHLRAILVSSARALSQLEQLVPKEQQRIHLTAARRLVDALTAGAADA